MVGEDESQEPGLEAMVPGKGYKQVNPRQVGKATGYRGHLSLKTRVQGWREAGAGRHGVSFSLTLSSRDTRDGAFGRYEIGT